MAVTRLGRYAAGLTSICIAAGLVAVAVDDDPADSQATPPSSDVQLVCTRFSEAGECAEDGWVYAQVPGAMTAPSPTSTVPGSTTAPPTTVPPRTTVAPATTVAPTTAVPRPTTTTAAPPTAPPTTSPGQPIARPTTPPAAICGNTGLLDGPAVAPAGAITVPAGLNSGINFGQAAKTYWFAPGVHTLGTGRFDQIQPGNGARFVGAPGAILDGQNRNVYAFTQHAVDVTIEHLTIRNFGTGLDNNNEGVVNHDAGDRWTIRRNTVIGNDGAGVFVGTGNTIRENCLKDNGQYGFSVYEPAKTTDVTIDRNEIVGNNVDDWETRQPGCGCTGGAKFWTTTGARVTGNWIHDNRSVGLWLDGMNVDFLIEGNWIEGNHAEGVFLEQGYNYTVRNNVLTRNAIGKGQPRAARGDNFPDAALYVSEAGGDNRHPSTVSGAAELRVQGNLFENNWNHVTLWENADRFCGSPANTSTGLCTGLGAASIASCVQPGIATEPLYTDCRWRTANVKVTGNEFRLDRAAVTGCAATPNYCGRVSLLSNYGTYPDWSPYKGTKVQQAITHAQGNVFAGNDYVGPVGFRPFETQNTNLTPAQWRAAPYSQDVGSTFT